MKNANIMIKLLTRPLTQIISFSIIILSGADFGAPFLWYIRFALYDKQLFAFVGTAAILSTAASIFFVREILQGAGLILMWISLGIFILQATPETRAHFTGETIPFVTQTLFVAVSVLVIIKYIRWKNF